MPCVRNQEALIGWGKGKQTDIATANSIGNMWRLNKLNLPIVNPRLNTESDAPEFGKSHEFATQVFKTNWEVAGSIEKYLSSQIAAWGFAFGLGKVVKTGTGPFTYTCTPLNTTTDGCEPPYFSYLQQVRPGAGVVVDQLLIGNALTSLRVRLLSGPGRQNSTITCGFVGTGKITDPSGLTMPAATAETLMPGSSMAFTMLTDDYVTLKRIESLEFGFDMNLSPRYFPGSGFQTGGDANSGQLAGALESQVRAASLSVVARFENGSTELAKLKAQTTGTAVISVSADANNSLTVTYHEVSYAVTDLGDSGGFMTVEITVQPRYHSANGLMTAVAITPTDGICQ